MSQADIERFTRDLQSNDQLRNEIKNSASGLTSIVDVARRHGYDVNVDEVKAHMRSQANQDLSDEQLEALAGGAGDVAAAVVSDQTVVQSVSLIQAVVISSTTSNTSSNTSAVVLSSGPVAVVA